MGTVVNAVIAQMGMKHDVLGLKDLNDWEFLSLMKFFGYDNPTPENQFYFDEERKNELIGKGVVLKYSVSNAGYYYFANRDFESELYAYRDTLEWVKIGGNVLFLKKDAIGEEA